MINLFQKNRDYIYIRSRYKLDMLRLYKLRHGCMDCGFKDNAELLDLDHVRGTKVAPVGKLAGKNASLNIIALEISKCDIVCKPCHKKRTKDRQNVNILPVPTVTEEALDEFESLINSFREEEAVLLPIRPVA
jgi:hypothetical protein